MKKSSWTNCWQKFNRALKNAAGMLATGKRVSSREHAARAQTTGALCPIHNHLKSKVFYYSGIWRMQVMTWKHTPSQEAGLGLLVFFIETTLPITQGTMLKISLLHLTWKKNTFKSSVCSFYIDFFVYKHTKQNYHGNAAISPSYSPVQNFCKQRGSEYHQLFTASMRFSIYLPETITSYQESETSWHRFCPHKDRNTN